MNLDALIGSLVFAFLVAFGLAWSWIIYRKTQRLDVLPYSARQPVPWGGLVVLIAFVVYLCSSKLALDLTAIVTSAEADQAKALTFGLAATGIIWLICAIVIVLALRTITQANRTDFGIPSGTVGHDLLLGILTFLAVAPPVYLLQALLSLLNETKHPVIELLSDSPSLAMFGWATFTAVIAAPIIEEFMFRVVLQGWLERRFGDGAPKSTTTATESEPLEFAASEMGGVASLDDSNPYAAGHISDAPIDVKMPSMIAGGRLNWLPIVISSLIFALFHIGQGLAPIALFFLALALGFLYQRTHRIVPCIVVHMLVNGLSMTLLWLMVTFGEL